MVFFLTGQFSRRIPTPSEMVVITADSKVFDGSRQSTL